MEKQISKLQQSGRLRRVGPDKGGHWHAQWLNYGLDNATSKSPGVPVTLPVVVLLGNEAFAAEPTLHYIATLNKTGTAK